MVLSFVAVKYPVLFLRELCYLEALPSFPFIHVLSPVNNHCHILFLPFPFAPL